jgi:hypothetical protein
VPQTLKSSPDGRIQAASFYSVGQIAVLRGVSHTTVINMINQGVLAGYRMPTKRRDRRVTHQALISFVRRNPAFRYILDKLDGYDSLVDFPEGTEPPQPTTRPMRYAPPRSSVRPRSVKRGKIPMAAAYSASEVAFVLGVSRRTVISKLKARLVLGIKVPSPGSTFSSWTWRVPHRCLTRFLRENSAFSYAWNRIQGCESGSDVPPQVGEVRPRKEPLVPPGAPGWKGRPHQTRRGGFKKGPKLPNGHQPSLTREDLAERES